MSIDQRSLCLSNFCLCFLSYFLFIALQESAERDNLMILVKARRSGQGPAKQLKTAKTSEESSSTSDKKRTEPDAVVSATQVSDSGPESLPQKPPNRRKMSLKKSLQKRAVSSETTHEKSNSSKNNSEPELLELLEVESLNFTSLYTHPKSGNYLLILFTGGGFDLSVISIGTSMVHI